MVALPKQLQKKYWLVLLVVATAIFGYAFMFASDPVDYNTEVKPLLNKKCISCHGGVKKKGGFSLLFRQEALDNTESGKPAIIPGNPDASEMIRRLSLKDPDERMPYHEKPLDEAEIDLLRRWIREGATWGDHWAYTPVREVAVPKPKGRLWGILPAPRNDWVRNEIDWFIAARHAEKGLKPSPEADKRILLRRVSLDLTGLPAPEHLARQYLDDQGPGAYERLVDSLLAQPSYGERWTALWMDLARYADTKGYERDDARSIWRYRDWLIRAFNENMPYDRFLTEQIAGDLLPEATDEQLIATAFHRNTLTNDEGGTDNEEFRVSAVIDRVNTTWEALMGTTFSCVQCHSHPYDPIRHEEYYKFMAFLNNTRDEDSHAEYPLLREYRKEDSARFAKLRQWLTHEVPEKESRPIVHFLRTGQPAINGLTADSFANAELADTKWLIMRNHSGSRLRHIDLGGKTQLLMRYMTWPKQGRLRAHLDSPDGPLLFALQATTTKGAWTIQEIPLLPATGIHDIYLEYQSPDLKNPDENGIMFDWFHFNNPFPGIGRPGRDSAYAWYRHLLDPEDVDYTPVLEENPADLFRPTHVFVRGNWLVKGEQVMPDLPKSLPPLPANAPRNRLGLAKWLTSTENPLTARTMVNRLWEQLFGQGLAETVEDLGTQGIPPTHPELLDWLAWQLMYADQWQLKQTLKRIVMSATYRQDARMTREAREADPFNRWYARGPRVRLTAEQVRDQALSVSGLLSRKMYGPSVMPYQPEGIWQSPWNGRNWTASAGEDQYRRAIYTYWKRSSPYPSMMNFDGTAREVCSARRIRTNTPLQALTTLNDTAYLVIARHFAYSLKEIYGNDYTKIIPEAYRRATGLPADEKQAAVLTGLYRDALDRFRKDPVKTCEMIGLQDEHNNPETAALVVVTNTILNLDEVITKN
jgi:hypothetical protein